MVYSLTQVRVVITTSLIFERNARASGRGLSCVYVRDLCFLPLRCLVHTKICGIGAYGNVQLNGECMDVLHNVTVS